MAIAIKNAEDLKTRLAEAGEKLVVIDFSAKWCGPCQVIEPTVEEFAIEYKDSVVMLTVDVDECQDLTAEYGITGVPTFVFIKNKQKLEEFAGTTYDQLKNAILRHK